jgi:ribonuclease HI
VAKCLTKMGMVEASIAAEAMAMYYAVSLCKMMGFQNLLLEGDAKVVFEALKERVPSCSRYGHLVEDTREVLKFFLSGRVNMSTKSPIS